MWGEGSDNGAAPSGPLFPGPIRHEATPPAVRDMLADITQRMKHGGTGPATIGTVQIVLAEILNNVCEHAQARWVTVQLHHDGPLIWIEVSDDGLEMPGESLPTGRTYSGESLADCPEGGFGWHLIRSLSTQLSYRREGGRNHLRCAVDAATESRPALLS